MRAAVILVLALLASCGRGGPNCPQPISNDGAGDRGPKPCEPTRGAEWEQYLSDRAVVAWAARRGGQFIPIVVNCAEPRYRCGYWTASGAMRWPTARKP